MSEHRGAALAAFSAKTGLPAIERVQQRGRDPELATFTFEFADGREVRVGTIKTLWSQTEMTKVFAVAIGLPPAPLSREDWNKVIRVLMVHAVEVEETPGETYEDTVRDWVKRYQRRAVKDADGAAAGGRPFTKDDDLYVSANDLALYVRREFSEQIKIHELRAALRDIGFERITVNYRTHETDSGQSTASYYRLPIAILETS